MRTLVFASSLVGVLVLGCSGDDAPGPSGADASAGGTGGSGGALVGGAAGGFPTGGNAGVAGGGAAGAPATGPTRYPATALRSPVTSAVAERIAAIAGVAPRAGNVFMKVGASNTVNTGFFQCFSGAPNHTVDLDGRTALEPTLTHFRAGEALGKTPFDRVSLAAKVGAGAGWAMTGSPAPVDQELAALDPRFALVHYGTNDMQLGVSHLSALFPFFENLSTLLDHLEASGVVPIVSGLPPRGDTAAAARWAPTYDAVTRAIAEARQLPFVSVYGAWKDLPSQGLISDGLHGNSFGGGACVLTGAGLQYGFNARNLLTLQQLHATHLALTAAAPDSAGPGFVGAGTASDPILIDQLPFTHTGDTTASTSRTIDTYPGCAATQNEAGPEVFYRLELATATALRVILLDRDGVDVDLHVLDGAPSGEACLARHDRVVQGTFGPGTLYVAVDSFVSSAGELSGRYHLVVLPCEAGDADCQ